MPSEVRNIVFTGDELLEAIRQFNAQADRKLPQGQFVRCRPIAGDTVSAVVEIDDAIGGGTKQVTLDHAYLVETLVNACLKVRIPLPRRARKSVRVLDDRVALHLSLPHKDPSANPKAGIKMPVPKHQRERVW